MSRSFISSRCMTLCMPVVFVKHLIRFIVADSPPTLIPPGRTGVHNRAPPEKDKESRALLWRRGGDAYQETNESWVGSWISANQRQVTFHLKTCSVPLMVPLDPCSHILVFTCLKYAMHNTVSTECHRY